MIAQNLAYVALASRDPGLTCAVLEQHLQLPRSEFDDTRGRPGSRRTRIGFVHPAAFGGILMHLVQRDG